MGYRSHRYFSCSFLGILENNLIFIDIKADNVFIDWQNQNDEICVDNVQLGDLEHAAHIPPGCAMIGKQAGNRMWRSPEAHARGPVNKPSDVFSFALVVSPTAGNFSSAVSNQLPSASAPFISASFSQFEKTNWKRVSIPSLSQSSARSLTSQMKMGSMGFEASW